MKTIVLPWNDAGLVEDAFRKHGDEIACVMMETHHVQQRRHLAPARLPGKPFVICATSTGALLVFDEVIFRFSFPSGRRPDTARRPSPISPPWARAVAAGFPVSALVGRKRKSWISSAGGKSCTRARSTANVIGMAAAKTDHPGPQGKRRPGL